MTPRLAAWCASAGLAAAVLPATASAASWTEIPSNTTADITAIEYQAADRFWFTTGDGRIFRRAGGVFEQVASDPTTVFRDIEFQAGGSVGFAVGTNGAVHRSSDTGLTWTKINGLSGGRAIEERCDLADQALGDVDAVRFAGPARAWIVGGGSQIFRTVDGATGDNVGSAAIGWQYINDNGTSCKIPNDIDDLFPVPSSDAAYFVGKSFGYVFFSSNALATAASEKPGRAGNGFQQRRRLAGDPGNPNRQWAVMPGGDGGSYVQRTTDGWNSAADWRLGNRERRNQSPAHDVDFAGGSVLAAGDGGMILHSNDGETFFFDDAAGGIATQDWRAVSAATANDAAVGGTNGKLAITSDLSVLPDVVAPTGAIAGPDTATAGVPVTLTAQVADDAGGSGINAASLAWTSSGLTPQSGATATFTFAAAGVHSVLLTFADNAGNTATASKTISVTTPAAPSLPKPTLPGPADPPVAGKVAKRKGRFVILRVRGRLGRPAGVSAAAACKGTMSLSVYKGKKRLAGRKATIRPNCNYKKKIKVKRSKVGKARKLKLKVAFKGNDALAPLSSTYKVRVR